jgi:hypothetical protein
VRGNYPFATPQQLRGLEAHAHITAIRLSILQLGLARRVLKHEFREALKVL